MFIFKIKRKCRREVCTLYSHYFLMKLQVGRLADFVERLPHDRKVQGSKLVGLKIVLNAYYGVIAVYPCGPASRFVERACTPLVPCYVLHHPYYPAQ